MTPAEPTVRRVPYSGLWRDDFSLVAVPGGALLAGGTEWHRDGVGATTRPSTGAAFWDAARGEWEELPPLPHPRMHPAAVALPDGRALLVGGRSDTPELASTLFWEPGTRRFIEGPPLRAARSRPSAVVLPDGAVLVVGADFDDDLQCGTRAELLRPGASAWEPAGQALRLFHPEPVCVSGSRVVIAGGRAAVSGGLASRSEATPAVEIWSPEHGTWTAGTPLARGRAGHQVAEVGPGVFLVVGNSASPEGGPETTSELWRPAP